MQHPGSSATSRERLWLPFMGPFYDRFAQPVGWAVFRAVIGLALVVESLPKIASPMGQIGFLEAIGFHPGWFWSPVLAGAQFVGGAMIALGLLTRPFALMNAVTLLVSVWYHVNFPYGDAFLTEAGVQVLKAGGDLLVTPQGAKRLADGGAAFLHLVQLKAELASLFWAGGCALFAAFGGGPFSVDRCFLKKEF